MSSSKSLFRITALLLSIFGSVAACGGDETSPDGGDQATSETTTALCSDEADNDGDGLVDCNDPGCLETPPCQTGPEPDTDTVSETDSGTPTADVADGSDSDAERGEEDCYETGDEDGNGSADCEDPVCEPLQECQPDREVDCLDTADNDSDGQADCADSDCAAVSECADVSAEVCDDGVDNDRNGLVDCFEPACADAPLCLQCNRDSQCRDTLLCFGDTCAEPFPRDYILYANSVTFELSNPSGQPWDADGSAPEGVVEFAINGERLERGRICPDGFYCDLSDVRFTVSLDAGDTLDIYLIDVDDAASEVVVQCTVPVTLELIRTGAYVCATDTRTSTDIVIAR